jgi:hypothetical protein
MQQSLYWQGSRKEVDLKNFYWLSLITLVTFAQGELVLPTLVFIFWAYGMYALISALSGRKGSSLRARSPWRRFGWLGLLAGAIGGLGLAVLLAQSFDDRNHDLKLTGFLGTVWAEGWPDKVEGRVEYPPLKSTASGDQPMYTLLHPDTSPAASVREKTVPRPRPAFKPRVRKAPASQGKGHKAAIQVAKKDQGAAKHKSKATKKKKPALATAGKKSTSG